MTETRAPLASQADIDAFIDAVWLEDGLSANTLAAYRRPDRLRAGWKTRKGYAREMADGEAAGGQGGRRARAGAGRHRSPFAFPRRATATGGWRRLRRFTPGPCASAPSAIPA